MPEILVVHPADYVIGDTAGNHSFALFIIQFVHLGNFVIHVAGIVLDCAPKHIGHQHNPSFAASFFQNAGRFPHGLPVHPDQSVPEVPET